MPGKAEAAQLEMKELRKKLKFYKGLLRVSGYGALYYSFHLFYRMSFGHHHMRPAFESMIGIFMIIAMVILGCLARLFYAMLEMQQLTLGLTHERDVENRE